MRLWHLDRLTGRRWVEVGPVALGFGPNYFLERFFFFGWMCVNQKAHALHVEQAVEYERCKEYRRAVARGAEEIREDIDKQLLEKYSS